MSGIELLPKFWCICITCCGFYQHISNHSIIAYKCVVYVFLMPTFSLLVSNKNLMFVPNILLALTTNLTWEKIQVTILMLLLFHVIPYIFLYLIEHITCTYNITSTCMVRICRSGRTIFSLNSLLSIYPCLVTTLSIVIM